MGTGIVRKHSERHFGDRVGWLRAAVLGANDGIVSTASLVVGVASANAARADVLLAAIAGLVAGAMSMAAGEYVSVSSQSDSEKADLDRERRELETDEVHEHEELAMIYVGRGLEPSLARVVATQLMAHDALAAHARDELGLSEIYAARPVQAALASAGAFAVGASLPAALVRVAPAGSIAFVVACGSLSSLVLLGAFAARVGGSSVRTGTTRVLTWGAMAMAVTAAVGSLFRVSI